MHLLYMMCNIYCIQLYIIVYNMYALYMLIFRKHGKVVESKWVMVLNFKRIGLEG